MFLPFCDTHEEELTDDCKGRRLFELDHERLRRIDGMLAVLHGPSLDDGVCMEIGYAAALGVPIIALTTDFQTYGLNPDGPILVFPDPLLDILLTDTVRVHTLGAVPPGTVENRLESFLQRNLQPLQSAADQAVATLLRCARTKRPRIPAAAATRTAYVEPSPYIARDLWCDVVGMLTAHRWHVLTGTRFNEPANPHAAACADWVASRAADLTLIDPSGPETPPGAALITGACAATGRLVIAAEPGGWWTFADGREPNWRNLMIQYAVSGRFRTVDELARLVDFL